MDATVSRQPPTQPAKPAGPTIFRRLKSDVPQDRADAVAELCTDARAKDRKAAKELIRSVTDKGNEGIPAIRHIIQRATEPELGIAALLVLYTIWNSENRLITLMGRGLGTNGWEMIEAPYAAIYAANKEVAMFGLEGLVTGRSKCVSGQSEVGMSDEAERILTEIASRSVHAEVALAAFGHMKLHENADWHLRDLLSSVHPEIREAARRKLGELTGAVEATG